MSCAYERMGGLILTALSVYDKLTMSEAFSTSFYEDKSCQAGPLLFPVESASDFFLQNRPGLREKGRTIVFRYTVSIVDSIRKDLQRATESAQEVFFCCSIISAQKDKFFCSPPWIARSVTALCTPPDGEELSGQLVKAAGLHGDGAVLMFDQLRDPFHFDFLPSSYSRPR